MPDCCLVFSSSGKPASRSPREGRIRNAVRPRWRRGWGQIYCLDQGFPDGLSIAWLNRHPALEWHRQGYVRIRLPAGDAVKGNAVTNNATADDGGDALQSTPGDLPDSETVKWLNRHPRMEWEIGGAMRFVPDVPGADFGWQPAALARASS